MKESNFCDIKYSRLLKDEFPDAEWWWGDNKIGDKPFLCCLSFGNSSPLITYYPAITSDMLLGRLPKWWSKNRSQMLTIIAPDVDGYWVNYCDHTGSCPFNAPECEDKILSNALAKLLIYLKEEKLL